MRTFVENKNGMVESGKLTYVLKKVRNKRECIEKSAEAIFIIQKLNKNKMQ